MRQTIRNAELINEVIWSVEHPQKECGVMCTYDKLKEEIRQIRKKLNALVECGASKEEIYKISVELDEKFVELMKLDEN